MDDFFRRFADIFLAPRPLAGPIAFPALKRGEAEEITEHAAPYDHDREELAEATDAAGEAAAFDFGAD